MSYIYLALAVVAEVIGTSLLKSTDEFTKLTPTAVVVVCYIVAMWLLTLVLREMAVGIVYAIWSGLGIVLVTAVAAVYYKEIPDLAAIIGMVLIVSGIVVMHLFSGSMQHQAHFSSLVDVIDLKKTSEYVVNQSIYQKEFLTF